MVPLVVAVELADGMTVTGDVITTDGVGVVVLVVAIELASGMTEIGDVVLIDVVVVAVVVVTGTHAMIPTVTYI